LVSPYITTLINTQNIVLLRPEWQNKLKLLFVLMIIMGFMPWEKLLSIQIINTTLNWLKSFTVGLAGLTGLLGFGLNWVGRNLKQYALLVKGIMICLITLISLFMIFTLVVPNFEWKDAYAYRSGNDYLVVQEFEGFVTSNLRNSRVVRTKYPNASIGVRELENLGIKELQALVKTYSKEMDAFFKSQGSGTASKEVLEAYKELLTMVLTKTGGGLSKSDICNARSL